MDRTCNLTSEIFQSIVQNVPRIEKISFHRIRPSDSFVEEAKCLCRLSALKSLGFDCQFRSFSWLISELGAAQSQLEYLRLSRIPATDYRFAVLKPLERLQKLDLIGCHRMELSDILLIVKNFSQLIELGISRDIIKVSYSVEIVRCASKLRELRFCCKTRAEPKFDEDLYMKILDVIALREDKRHLDIMIPQRTLSVPEHLQRSNERLLKIKTEYSTDYSSFY